MNRLVSESRQKIFSNTGWLFVDRIIRMPISLVVGVLVTRYLGPEQFGQLNYAIAWVSIFSAVASLGLDSIAVREIVLEPQSKNRILGTILYLRLLGGIFTWLLVLASSQIFLARDPLTSWLVLILSAGVIFQSLDTIDLWFQSQVKSHYAIIGKTTSFILINLAKVVLIQKNAPLIAFAWAGLGEILLGAIGLLITYRISGDNIFKWVIDFSKVKKLLSDSYPLIFSGLLVMFYMRVDQIMISIMRGDKELGLYSAAVRLAEFFYFIPMAISSSTLPSIIEAKETSESLFYEKIQKLYVAMASIGYATAIPISIMSDWLVNKLYGIDFSGSGKMLTILVWAGIFVNLGIARSSFLIAMNWTKLHLFSVLLGAITNIILNFIFIPRFGGVGASVATLVSYWIATHLSCFTQKKLFKNGVIMTKSLALQTN
jgi:O-antigen/teichoic acid export membrane protein